MNHFFNTKLNSLNKNEKGLTVAELLVVITIIAILAAIAIPTFFNYTVKAAIATVQSDVKNTVTSIEVYITQNPDAIEADLKTQSVISADNTMTIIGNSSLYTVCASSPKAPEYTYGYNSLTRQYSEGCNNDNGENPENNEGGSYSPENPYGFTTNWIGTQTFTCIDTTYTLPTGSLFINNNKYVITEYVLQEDTWNYGCIYDTIVSPTLEWDNIGENLRIDFWRDDNKTYTNEYDILAAPMFANGGTTLALYARADWDNPNPATGNLKISLGTLNPSTNLWEYSYQPFGVWSQTAEQTPIEDPNNRIITPSPPTITTCAGIIITINNGTYYWQGQTIILNPATTTFVNNNETLCVIEIPFNNNLPQHEPSYYIPIIEENTNNFIGFPENGKFIINVSPNTGTAGKFDLNIKLKNPFNENETALLKIGEIDYWFGNTNGGTVSNPRGLDVDSQGNLYYSSGFTYDPGYPENSGLQYYITSKLNNNDDVSLIEHSFNGGIWTTLYLNEPKRATRSAYCKNSNSVFAINNTGASSYLTEYVINGNNGYTFKNLGSTGTQYNFNQRVTYLNSIIAVHPEHCYVYIDADYQGTNRWQGIWEVRPNLPVSEFMTNQGGTTEILNDRDVVFTNTQYQNDVILGQLFHRYTSFAPQIASTGGAGVVIAKTSTSFTVRFDGAAVTNLTWYKRSNWVAINVELQGQPNSTLWYELDKNIAAFGHTATALEGTIVNNILWFPMNGKIYNTSVEENNSIKTRAEQATLSGVLGLDISPSTLPTGSAGILYAYTNNAVYRKGITGNIHEPPYIFSGNWILIAGGKPITQRPMNGIGENATFAGIRGIAASPDGYLYVSDYSSANAATSSIRKINPNTGLVTYKYP